MNPVEFKYILVGDPTIKLGLHNGFFTRSYYEVRAIYDAKIRNWEIELRDNLFLIKDSNEIIEKIYYEYRRNFFETTIANCSCIGFIENQCGTCMHIEAVKLAIHKSFNYNIDLLKIRPLCYINNNFDICTIGSEANVFDTPSVISYKKYYHLNDELSAMDYSSLDVDVFNDYNIYLRNFQIESVRSMLQNKRTVLTLPMGLGKTLCALACIKILGLKRVLIVTPNSLKFQWQEEINRFNLGCSSVISKSPDIEYYFDQQFLIISYEMLNRNPKLLEREYDILIADEIQKIKNSESKTWNTLSKIKTNFIFSLSGTPIENNINDLISLISLLNPFEFKPDWKFYEQYCIYSRAKILGIKPEMVKLLRSRLSKYIINPVVDYTQFKMPSKNEFVVQTQLNIEQRAIHDPNINSAKLLISKSFNYPLTFSEKSMLNSMLTTARMAATDARLFDENAIKSEKFLKIENLINEIVSRDEKVIVYSQWIKTLEFLIPFLNENNVEYVFYYGKLTDKKRDLLLKKFIKNSDVKVFLSTDTGGQGLDGLQFACNNIIHVEKIWNPMKISQRNGRLVRFLQAMEYVNIYYFETISEIDFMINENHIRKYKLIADMLN